MFFRREKIRVPTFSERLDHLKSLGLTVSSESSGKARINRGRCAAIIEDRGMNASVHVNKAGVIVGGGDIGTLVSGGYQMFWKSAKGTMEPALAPQLKALHAFEEDLKEGLEITSLYNESLGTTSDQHMYDRVLDRDRGVPARPWEK